VFVRETTSKRKHGPDVIYLHLARNVWDPKRKTTRTEILHSFGRKDKLDLDEIRRLVKSLSSYLPPVEQLHLLPKDFTFLWSRQFGHLYLLYHLWKKFGLDDFFKEELAKRSFETPLEKHLYRAMDFLFEHLKNLEVKIYNQIVDLFSLDVSIIFYDTSSIYFEITGMIFLKSS